MRCDRLITQAQATTQLIADYGLASETAALLLSRTGYYYFKQGRYGEAELPFQQALTMRKRLLGEDHPDIAQSLHNLATLYSNQGHHSEAEHLSKLALVMRKQLLGDEHPDVARSLKSLGILHYNQGRYREAQTLLLQAQPIYLANLSPNHPNTQALQSWIDLVQTELDSQIE